MEKPKAYGPLHLAFLLIGIPLCVFLAWKLRRTDERGNKMVIFGCGLFLTLCEVYKQLFYFYVIEQHSYPWWIFPFQMCSVPMYLCLIAPWLKKGNVRQGMYSFMMLFNFLGGIMSLLEPSGLCHSYWTLTLHAFVWHTMLIFIGLYLTFSGRGGREKKDFRYATVTFLILCAVAFALNVALRDVSGGAVNNFYIGPSNSPLVVFKTICQKFGWFANALIYIPCVTLGAYVIFWVIHLAKKKASQ